FPVLVAERGHLRIGARPLLHAGVGTGHPPRREGDRRGTAFHAGGGAADDGHGGPHTDVRTGMAHAPGGDEAAGMSFVPAAPSIAAFLAAAVALVVAVVSLRRTA